MHLANLTGKQIGMAWQGRNEVYSYPATRIQWSILRRELLQLCKEQSIPVLYEKTSSRVEEHGNNIVLHFSNEIAAEASLLIDANGIRSVVREHIIPDCNPYYYRLCVIYRMMKWGAIGEKIKE